MYTSHGHQIRGTIAEFPRPKSVARCGGPGLCISCSKEAQTALNKLMEADPPPYKVWDDFDGVLETKSKDDHSEFQAECWAFTSRRTLLHLGPHESGIDRLAEEYPEYIYFYATLIPGDSNVGEETTETQG